MDSSYEGLFHQILLAVSVRVQRSGCEDEGDELRQKYSVALNVIHQKRNHVQMSSLIYIFLKYKSNKVYIIYPGIFKIVL